MSLELEVFTVTLTTVDPIRIGALQDPLSDADQPIARLGERPVIQGPSLKGALRAQIERHLIDQYPDRPQMRPCIPAARLSKYEEGLRGYRGPTCALPASPRRRGEDTSICPACYLLGAMGLPGFVRVPFLKSDAVPDELYSVRLDRRTGAVVTGSNRSWEVLPDGAEFVGTLEIVRRDSLTGWELGKPREPNVPDDWLKDGHEWSAEGIISELLVERMQAVTVIGGHRSKGCGRVRITVEAAPGC